MRYLPFIIISLVLYTLFFYNNQQPELLSTNSDQQTTKKIIPLDFKKVAEQDNQATKSAPTAPLDTVQVVSLPEVTPESVVTPEALAIPDPVIIPPVLIPTLDIPEKEEIIALNVSPKIMAANYKQLQASIKLVSASDTALLKSDFFERDFHLELPAPPELSASKKSQSETEVILEVSKPKRSFKKQIKAIQVENEQGLQNAIAVSGNKPHYPKKAKADKQQGLVTVQFTVNMQGKTSNPQIITSSGHIILDNALLEFIKNEHFMPALKGIEKVTREQLFSFMFSLK